jgi:two-component system, NarL family, sensor histidine kinase UhpB
MEGGMRRWPLVYQILLVNSAIVFLGATFGTAMTRTLASQSSAALTATFAALGLLLSVLANYMLLRVALRPLRGLQTVAELVTAGNINVRAAVKEEEPALTRLGITFNAMLDRLEENTRAIERSRAVTEQLTQKVLSAQEEERRRIARELHDETLQSLATLVIYADAAHNAAKQGDTEALGEAHAALRQVAELSLTGIRAIIADLRPSLLDDLGLAAAVRWQAQHRLESAGVRVDVQVRGEGRRLSPLVETALYRVIQEAITNILKHASASYVEIDLDLSQPDRITARIEDNGTGFEVAPFKAGDAEGVGLFGMRERVNLVGGELAIDSSPGEGTEIRIAVPVQPVEQLETMASPSL